uniref:Uncharacterized protein n=1 Tax=Nelumbo nucifera TaxID=4432 RepID=A0A822Z8I7_NELNU|nr:TPA_asm: hypothetical protein HUJ06_000904 [Nelumbo nucifera]
MKLWMVLRSYGVANLRNFLRTHVKMAKHFEEKVTMDKRFEIVVPRNFAMVCFWLLPPLVKDHEMRMRCSSNRWSWNVQTRSTISCWSRSTRLGAYT